MTLNAKLVFTAVVSVVLGGLAAWVGKPPPAPNSRYSMRLNLVDPTNGGPVLQPTTFAPPTSKDDSAPGADEFTPPGQVQTIEVVLGEPSVTHPHEDDDGGGNPGPHCHMWVKVGNTWYQVHCGP